MSNNICLTLRKTVSAVWAATVSPAVRRHLSSVALIVGSACIVFVPQIRADVVADSRAPGSLKPYVTKAASGITQVNIQKPSAAGVSRNIYSQFDVERRGVILNNSQTPASTQLGGWINGNPNLANGTAKIILNEVNSSNPSRMLGYVEIGGTKAQVVVANPAGITCSGCGFINASRATLTTGSPIMKSGKLDGFQVNGGTITIEGDGLDTSSVNYTDLIARAVKINAGVWANNLNVTTGLNRVSASNGQITNSKTSGGKPEFAIDVASLGGMYAGKIKLVGTEQGVGVRNAGRIGSSVGQVSITADGRLVNSGSITSATNTRINTSGDIVNSGVVRAKGTGSLATQGSIDNTQGSLAAKGNISLSAVSINNTQGLMGSEIGKLVVDAGTGMLVNDDGRIEAAQGLTLNSTGLSNNNGYIVGKSLSINTKSQSLNNVWGTIVATGSLNLQTGILDNDSGLIQSAGALTINTHGQKLNNTNSGAEGGIIGQSSAEFTVGDLDNAAGFIYVNGMLTVNSGAITNTNNAIITSEQGINITGASLDNRDGQIQSLESASMQITGTINNAGGLIRAGQALNLTAGDLINSNTLGVDQGIEGNSLTVATNQINNSSGAMRADQMLSLISRGYIDNSSGLISSAGTVQIIDPNASGKTLAVSNASGTIIADQLVSIDSASLSISGNGELLSLGDIDIKLLSDFVNGGAASNFAANGDISLEAGGIVTNLGSMQAGGNLLLTAGSINNEASGEIIATSVTLNATDTHTFTNRGLIDGGDTFINSAVVNNLGTGRIYGDHLAIAATTLNNKAESSNAPVIAARSRLDIGATTINNREGALIFSSGDMYIGGSLDGDNQAIGKLGTLNNNSASIEALGNLTISAGQINNTNEHITTQTVVVGTEDIDVYRFGGRSYSPDEVYFTWTKTPGVKYYPPDSNGMSYMNTKCFFCDNSDNNIYIHTSGGVTRDFWLYSYTRTTTETQLLTSAPGKINAGGDMQIEADNLYNSNSQIVAGGNLLGTFGTVTNEDTPGKRIVTNSGTAWYIFDDDDHDDSDRDAYGYHPAPTESDFILSSSRLEGNSTPNGSGTTLSDLDVGSVTEVASGADDAGTVIRTISIGTTLPGNSLFQTNPDQTSSYLIETDPQFANYRNWLSSDYMLLALGLDPALSQKRMGDGFYEQRLLSEQVAKLTGQRYMAGYNSDEEQYRALMNAGITFAQEYNLTPGIALSAEQMAQLTSDIVWLVEQEVTLADGSTQKVLVPQLYAHLQEGDLLPSGTLLAANNIQFDVSGGLINSGSIAGRQITSLTAENIRNLGGRVSGRQTYVSASNDLSVLGGSLEAQEQLIARAGRNMTIASTTRNQENAQGRRTAINRVAGLYVTGENGTLVASAGNDLSLIAAVIKNAEATAAGEESGSTSLIAGNNLKLGTVTTKYSEAFGDKRHKRQESNSNEVGSVIQTTGDLTLLAEKDVSVRAAEVNSAEGALTVQAGKDIQIESGTNTLNIAEQHKYKKKSTFSSKKTTIRKTLNDSSATASTLSGDSVTLNAGGDIGVKGSNVVATNDANLQAEGDINIESAEQTHNETYYKKTKKSGVFSSGAGITLGSQKMSTDTRGQSTTAAASTVGSIEGDVNIEAGKTYNQKGSDLIALEGDININAGEVNIEEAREINKQSTKTKFKQSGLSVSISSPVIDMAQTAQRMKKAASKTDDPRMQALAAATTGLAASNTYDAVKNGQTVEGANLADQVGGIKLSVSLGSSKSKSSSTSSSDTARGSTLTAGGDININALEATSAGEEEDSTKTASGDINIKGSDLTAGKNIKLQADNDINIQSAQNRYSSQSKSKSSSASVGVSFNLGANAGVSLDVAASKGKGKSKGNAVTHSNSHITAGEKLTINSGKDTTLKGAVAKGEQVEANVGGNLTIESQQDTDNYKSKSSNRGFSASVGLDGKSFGGSINSSKSNIDSEYASVKEQSGIKAGDKGFQVDVDGHTQLKGAVIASTDAAVENNRNSFSTGSLGMSDIQNKAKYEADSTSIGVGYSSSGEGVGTDSDGNVVSNGGTPNSTLANLGGVSATPPTAMSAEGEAESTTRSGISGIAGDKSVRSDKDGSNSLDPIFDEEEINAGFEIVGAFSREVGTFLKHRAEETTEAWAELKEEQAKPEGQRDEAKMAALKQTLKDNLTWEVGGTGHQILTALTAAAAGNITGSGAEFMQAATVNYLQSLGAQEVKTIADNMGSETARTALHGLLACAGATAQGGSCGSAALGASSSVVLNNLLDVATGMDAMALTTEEKDARVNLLTTVVAGITTAAGGDAALATASARIESENNIVWVPIIMGAVTLIDKGITAYEAWQDIKAVRSGEKTVEEIAKEKGEEYVAGVLLGNVAKYGVKIAKVGGKWVSEKIAKKGDDVPKSGRNFTQDILSIKRLKGNSDIAPGARADAETLGNAWVNGKNVQRFELDHGGYGLTDGTRTFRLQYKPKDGIWKANFQENTFVEGRAKGIEIKNVHMNITDMVAP